MNEQICMRVVAAWVGWIFLIACCAALAAAEYPTRPIRLVVPFAAGGGADTLARIITPKLGEAMGQQWVVDNRGGAGGNVAAEIVVQAAPDGHTVFLSFNTVLTVNPTLVKVPYQVEKDLQPVTLLATAQYNSCVASERAGKHGSGVRRPREGETRRL
jgi:tripartite-type tricarboxylate transporter receptor subunit TctC